MRFDQKLKIKQEINERQIRQTKKGQRNRGHTRSGFLLPNLAKSREREKGQRSHPLGRRGGERERRKGGVTAFGLQLQTSQQQLARFHRGENKGALKRRRLAEIDGGEGGVFSFLCFSSHCWGLLAGFWLFLHPSQLGCFY